MNLPILTNPVIVRRRASQMRDENFDFRSWIKGWCRLSDDELDEEVQEITDRVWEQIDCTTCANCCRLLQIVVDDEDIARLAARLELSIEEFRGEFVQTDEVGDQVLASEPCVFLEGNRCTVYEDRPKVCRQYPYLYEEKFRSRLLSMIDRAEDCPIVFNTLELLKRTRGWQPRR